MKVAIPGHAYQLDSYDGGEPITLYFMMRHGEKYPGNDGTGPGTNCQEVLRALIDRCQYLDKQIPSIETRAAIRLMRSTILQFEIRAKRVKGQRLALPGLLGIEHIPTCKICGHIFCAEHV